MQLKEEFRTYEALRREHDAQIVQIATEAGLRIAPEQWSSLLYGDTAHKSHMQSIIDKVIIKINILKLKVLLFVILILFCNFYIINLYGRFIWLECWTPHRTAHFQIPVPPTT